MRAQTRLVELIGPVVTGLGYELVGVEFDGRQRLLRVYIDSPHGIALDDCSRVSNQVSGMLDVEDPITGRYQLEISSPGLERPLFTLEHYERFKGEQIRLQLTHAIQGRKRFKARLMGVDLENVLLQEGDETLAIPFDAIEKARLAPEF